jgi:hypothetical protein
MRSFTALACTIAITGCSGTDGDILRTRSDGSVTQRPRPAPLGTWQIQLSGALDTTVDVRSYTVDVATPASVIAGLHDAGRIVLCYFSAGTREPFRADASRFPASTLGAPLVDYPNERWVDIRDATVRAIMRDRIIAAAGAGCDGVHPSGVAAFQESTNLDFTRDDQVGYDRWLATVAHALGLSIGLVDVDAALSGDLVADFDWAVLWTCLATNCAPASPFTGASKPVFLIEYGDETQVPAVCPKARSLGLSAIIKRDGNLDAFRVGCP